MKHGKDKQIPGSSLAKALWECWHGEPWQRGSQGCATSGWNSPLLARLWLHPRMVWDWYQERRERVLQAQPNPAHLAIAALAKRKTVTVVTQNVDGLHQRAGSEGVIELHGNLFVDKWLGGCGKCDVATAEPGRPPRCATCGAMLRPGVVWFGEQLPLVANYRAEEAANTCDVCLVVGTSGMVYPAAGLPGLAKDHGAKVIVVNPEPSALDGTADLVIHQPAGVCLPAMLG